ncbi:hypothetical protein FOA52_010217 [Chlamydomonas sp. UWO 241]|nr:hypothetical protein FOA52_010217 [Chlamydomonas sp. UWO 241]
MAGATPMHAAHMDDDAVLAQHLPELLPLEEALLCHICGERMGGPVMLACGHTFCSACIRGNLDYRSKAGQTGQCPNCRAPAGAGRSPAIRKTSQCTGQTS